MEKASTIKYFFSLVLILFFTGISNDVLPVNNEKINKNDKLQSIKLSIDSCDARCHSSLSLAKMRVDSFIARSYNTPKIQINERFHPKKSGPPDGTH